MPRCVLLLDVADPPLEEAWRGLADVLTDAGLEATVVAGDAAVAGAAPDADVVLVVADRPPLPGRSDDVLTAARGRPVLLAGPTARAWQRLHGQGLYGQGLDGQRFDGQQSDDLGEALGLLLGAPTPPHEVRVRPGPARSEVLVRHPGDLLAPGEVVLRVDKVADDVDVLLQASVALVEHPVATLRRTGPAAGALGLLALGGSSASAADPAVRRAVVRVVRHVLGLRDAPAVRVGLLGYGAIGAEHSLAVQAVAGLELAAVCDPGPGRSDAARALAPGLRAAGDLAELLADDAVDLVVVSTPPDRHAEHVLAALEAGKHVVVEKPFCLTTEEADRQVAAAAERGRVLAVYQNRRFDADYLALARAVRSGALGTVFSSEWFIGGHGHPCSYWHSDVRVSGGAVYDWGSHVLDQILALFRSPVEWVSATAHHRVWHDVTNADHTRVLLHLADGTEHEFIVSDLAAARKPKFFLLGTHGALVGDWRYERVVGRDAVGRLVEDPLEAADSPARLRLLTPDGTETVLAVPPAPPQPFHRELADRLVSGTPHDGDARGLAARHRRHGGRDPIHGARRPTRRAPDVRTDRVRTDDVTTTDATTTEPTQ